MKNENQYLDEYIDSLKTERQMLYGDLNDLKPYADIPVVRRHIQLILRRRKELFNEIGELSRSRFNVHGTVTGRICSNTELNYA